MIEDTVKTQFEAVFKDFNKDIVRYVGFRVADKHEAEDLAANTFLRFWQRFSAAGSEQIQNPRALLYTIAHGLVVDHYRKSARRANFTTEFIDEVYYVADQTDNTNSIDAKSQYAEVLNKLNTLSDEYREVVSLHYIEEQSIAEIALILNESENNIRVRLHRALEKLRKQFDYERT